MFSSSILQMKVKSRDSKLSWLALFASAIIMCCSYGFLYNFGIFYNHFVHEYGYSKEKTAWVGSIPISLLFFMAPFASWVLNKFTLRTCAMASAVPLAASLLVTSFARDLDETFVTFSIPFGIAGCVIFMGTMKSVYLYFDKQLATAYGLLTGGSILFQVGLSYLMIALLNNFGLEKSFRILSAVVLVTCLVAAQAYFPTSYDEPQEKKDTTTANSKGISLYFGLLKHKLFNLFLLANFVLCFSYSVSSVHQVQFAVEFGVPEKIARQLPVFSGISNALGRLSTGFITDSKVISGFSYFQLALSLHGLSAIIGSFLTNQKQLIAYVWLYAFFDGSVQASCPNALRTIVDLKFLTEAFSITLTAGSISMMLGPPFLGFIVDQTKNYHSFFYLAGIPPLAACLLLIPIRLMKRTTQMTDDVKEELKKDEEAAKCCLDIDEDIGKLLQFETAV